MPPLATSTSPVLRVLAPVKAPRSWPKQFALEQGFGQGPSNPPRRRGGWPAGSLRGWPGRPVPLPVPGLPLQQHGRFGRGDAGDQFQHRQKRRRPPDQALVRRESAGDWQRLQLFDEEGDLPIPVADRRQFDVLVTFPAGGVVEVHHAFPAGRTAGCAPAGRIRRPGRRAPGSGGRPRSSGVRSGRPGGRTWPGRRRWPPGFGSCGRTGCAAPVASRGRRRVRGGDGGRWSWGTAFCQRDCQMLSWRYATVNAEWHARRQVLRLSD